MRQHITTNRQKKSVFNASDIFDQNSICLFLYLCVVKWFYLSRTTFAKVVSDFMRDIN